MKSSGQYKQNGKRYSSKASTQDSFDEHSYSALVIVLLMLAAAFLLYFRANQDENSARAVANAPINTDQTINKYLKQGARNQEIREQRFENDQPEFVAPAYGESANTEQRQVNQLLFDQENSASQIAESLDRQGRKLDRSMNPDDRINSKLARDEIVRDMDRKYEAEFVRQFIEKAREKGVNIEVDEDLNVTGYDTFEVKKPVRIPQSIPEK